MRHATRTAALAALASGFMLGGCFMEHRPEGNMRSADMFTYQSTTYEPISLSLVDTRSGEVLWATDVPVGQKVTVRFFENQSEGDLDYPDVMRYEIFGAGALGAMLRSQMPVPPAPARRLDMFIRETPAYHADGGVMNPDA